MRLLFLPILIVSMLSANGQALWRNFFTTNQNPRVTVTAGSNVTVQASTVGVDQRIFTVNSVPPTNVLWASFATNAGFSTNATWASFATNANFATNASNATNFWGALSPTNIPSLNYISNNVGNGTNVTLWGSNNVIKADGLGTTITPTIWLTNGTAAALGAQQYSPALALVGGAWDTTFSSNTPINVIQYVLPSQGDQFNKRGKWVLASRVGGTGAFNTMLDIRTDGPITTQGGITIPNANTFSWSSRCQILSPADQDVQLYGTAGTAFNRLFLGPANSSWPALKVETTNAPTLSVRNGADGNYASLMASNVTAQGNIGMTATNFVLSMPQWNDLIGTYVTAGASAPSPIALSNNYAIKLSGYQHNDDSHWQVQMPHNIAITNAAFVLGTNVGQWHVEPHVHFMAVGSTIDATHSNVTWGIEWVTSKLNGYIIASGTNEVTTGVTANGFHYYVEFGPITNAAPYNISDIMAFRLYRKASALRDLAPNGATRDVALLGFDVHAPVGNNTTLGSRAETSQ